MEIKKAIILAAGLGTRFLPLSKVLPKEFWPLVEKPMIQYAIEEAKKSGISEIIFVVPQKRNWIFKYFKKEPKLKKILKEKKKNQILAEIEELEKISEGMKFSFVYQKKPLGDGQAILLTEKFLKEKACAILYPDDIVESKIPCTLQLIEAFKKYRGPIDAISRIEKEKIPFYGIVAGEKIAPRIYKLKKIAQKPPIKKAPSNLAIIGRRIITEEVFYYLKKTKPFKGEIDLTTTLAEMVKKKKNVYGLEIEGKWLECGNKLSYLKSNLYLSLKSEKFGPELKKFLRKIL
jgi:UTP--glucose-1-phosphate uridylyltransferase